jgi:H+/Cl- antiporter ClcA
VHDLEGWLWDGDSTAWYLVIGLPAVGAVLVYLARRFLPGDGGNPPIEGIGGAPARVRDAPGITLAAIGTLSFGAVLGPEAPLIAIGSIVGLAVTLFTKVGERQRRVLGTAGSFSAISALFGGPVVAGTMMVEGGLEMGAGLLPVLLPGFVAAASGYLLFVGFGSWGGLHEQGLAVPDLPAYHGEHLRDLIVAVVVGVLAALTISGVRRLSGVVSGIGIGMALLLIGGGLAVGLLAQIADWLGANSQDVLFSGQSGVPALAAANSTKIVVIPAVFLGIALATFAVVWFDVSPTLAVAVGAAAGMAAGTQLLITSTLFASLLVGDAGPDAIPAAVFAAAAAWLTMRALAARSKPAAPIT